ncbi:MAG: haloacid dehalogenase-like hydrolase [Candidatus Thalassarchaeaceae archaeon]|nr:haloacid dehalogenase-like hydrolase [Candidatus Thalassarchaeaceae archaeon]MDP6318428.1 haloacid dehalogenase-like hydrolase [Candidatus Thalassarchaeaceae archaeon]DAC35103.1 MAG TPA: hypothetical protein D7H79_02935 [Candidatus Poseidoniales archaeon]HIH80164.1 hypothetical protein [Candidatus Thalassarchaeaceae archaeon]HJM30469.1 haloacid dehalogenase-like hydrolase [Candidatus Thalassarchaeaceae archaeon]
MIQAPDEMPLAVDMDGTLILTDMSRVSARRVFLRQPWMILSTIFLELTGRRAKWKKQLARKLKFDPDELVYHEAFVDWLTGEKARGRTIILATASDQTLAEIIAAHVGLFDDVMGSDGITNLRGLRKAEALTARFGKKEFGYAGNSKHDIPVWEHCGQVIVVNAESGLLDKVGDSADLVFE